MLTPGPTLQQRPIHLLCDDGVPLSGHIWTTIGSQRYGTVIINPATGVLARYYHRYARFLAEHGFDVVTYDYRGIGASRPERLRGCGFRWRDWGEHDFDTVLRFALKEFPDAPLLVVGHSIGGFLPGLSKNAGSIRRMLTIGAQYAYWNDYASSRRISLFLKWHVIMPALTVLFGYFPGRKLGWLEDLPAGVAHEWSFRRNRVELSYPADRRNTIVRRLAAVTASILAIAVSDDDIGTSAAIRRTLRYYRNATATEILLTPADLGYGAIGHFDLFHAKHVSGFWLDTVLWLRDGINPWPRHVIKNG